MTRAQFYSVSLQSPMKILFLLPRFPWPLDKGDRLRAFHMIRGLSHNHEVHLFALERTSISENRVGAVTPYLASLRTESLSVRSRWLGALGVVASPTPLQVGYFRRHTAFKEIGEAISRIGPDVIMCQSVRMAEYVPERSPALRVLDFMDAFSLRSQTRSDFHRGPSRWFWKLESRRLRLSILPLRG